MSGMNCWDRRLKFLSPERFRGQHPGHRGGILLSPSRACASDGPGFAGHTDGAKTEPKLPVEISLSPLETEEGTLVSQARVRDITERKRRPSGSPCVGPKKNYAI